MGIWPKQFSAEIAVPLSAASEIERLAEVGRLALIEREEEAVKRVNAVYARLAGRQRRRIRELVALAKAAEDAGLDVPTAVVVRREQAVQLLEALVAELRAAAAEAGRIAGEGAGAVASAGASAAAEALALIGRVFEPNLPAIRAQANLLATPVLEALLESIGEQAAKEAGQVMLQSVAEGWGARRLGAELFRVAAADGLPLARAELIARTEMIRAYREGSRGVHLANADLVLSVRWLAAKAPRTCAACLALDGRTFPVGYSQQSHPACRCTLVPVTSLDAGPSLTGDQYADSLSLEEQEAIFGAAGNRLRRAGWVNLGDFAQEGFSPTWGRSYTVRSQSRLLALARDRGLPPDLGMKRVKGAGYSGRRALPVRNGAPLPAVAVAEELVR